MLNHTDIKYFKMAVGSSSLGRETSVDIVARCPVCGDSSVNKNKKRLHLYNKNNETRVNCFNGDCPVNNKSVYGFLRDHFPSYLAGYKRETFVHNMDNISETDESSDVFSSFLNPVKEEPKKETADITTHDLRHHFNTLPYAAMEYIRRRGYEYNENDYGEWFFGKNDLYIGDKLYRISNSLIIPLYYNGEMYGFYSRDISKKEFSTYMPEQNMGYKIWNWFNVDKEKPVYIFEGIFDAISSGLDNVIACLGAKIPDERIKEIKHPVFVLDNDKTGWKNSLNYSEKGYGVYIQPSDLIGKDINEVKINHPEVKMSEMIKANTFKGISAEVRIKRKL